MSNKFLHFSSIFTNEEVNKFFYNHLLEEKSTESLNFIMEVEKFKKDKTEEKMKTIYERFIIQDSKEEINISSSEKKKLLDLVKNLEKEKDFEKVEELLEKTSKILKKTLFNDKI
jgi:hypothetical protein